MQKWMGVLIKQERLRQNLSQEGVCRGVCAVSYLSKIEKGRVEPGQDILDGLFQALGLRLEQDEEFLQTAERYLTGYFDRVLPGADALRGRHAGPQWVGKPPAH